MIDLIILYLLARVVRRQALRKGQPVSRWQWRLVLLWLGLEFFGLAVGLLINRNLVLAGLLGFGLAFGGYLIVRHQLDSLPDAGEKWEDRIGRS